MPSGKNDETRDKVGNEKDNQVNTPRLVNRKSVAEFLKSLGMARIDKKLFDILDIRVADLLRQAVWRVKEKNRRGIMYYDI